ncbi:MAG: flippase-like domain-containing protein [Candidatus Bathyarchaeota archaeon]|nr:flippase-like domain-containing protein [Candidatus Bathyarchaeota archaeon]
MQARKPKITRKALLFPLIGLVAFFAYIYLFQVDIATIVATAQHADPLPYVVAIGFSLAEVLFFSVSWRVLANFLAIRLSVIKSYLYVWYSIFVDTLIPAESISGEAIRVYLITREQGSSKCGQAVASLVVHRLLGMGLNIVVLIVGMFLLFTETQVSPLIFNLILFLASGIAVTLFLIVLFSFKETWILKIIDWLTRLGKFLSRGKWQGQLTKIKEDACRIVKSFHDSMKEFKHKPQAIVFSLFYLTLSWILSLSIPYLVFLSLRFPVSWSVILVTSTIVLAVKSIPVGIPFEVGIPEITMTTLYTSLGVPAGISATATLMSRLITLWLKFAIGFVAQQLLELKPVLAPMNNLSIEKA